MDSGKIVLGFLAGAAVGASLGILFAPDKGSATRKKILDKGNELGDELTEKYNDLMEALEERFEAMQIEGEKAIAESKAELQNKAHDIRKEVHGQQPGFQK